MSASDEEEGGIGYERVVAFSDGVFAIAITLLVLQLDVPDLPDTVSGDELARALRDLAPQALSYFIGFAVIGAFWLGHHRFFDRLRGVDGLLMVLNLVFLAFISLMPFTTGVFGRFGHVEVSVVLYALNVVAASAADTAMLWAAMRRRLLEPGAVGDPRWTVLDSFFPGIVFLCSIPVAFVDPSLAPWTWLGLLLARPIGQRAHRGADDG